MSEVGAKEVSWRLSMKPHVDNLRSGIARPNEFSRVGRYRDSAEVLSFRTRMTSYGMSTTSWSVTGSPIAVMALTQYSILK